MSRPSVVPDRQCGRRDPFGENAASDERLPERKTSSSPHGAQTRSPSAPARQARVVVIPVRIRVVAAKPIRTVYGVGHYGAVGYVGSPAHGGTRTFQIAVQYNRRTRFTRRVRFQVGNRAGGREYRRKFPIGVGTSNRRRTRMHWPYGRVGASVQRGSETTVAARIA